MQEEDTTGISSSTVWLYCASIILSMHIAMKREKDNDDDDEDDELNRLREKQTAAQNETGASEAKRHRSSSSLTRCFFSLRTMFLLHYRHLSHYLSDNIDNDTITLKTARRRKEKREEEIRVLF